MKEVVFSIYHHDCWGPKTSEAFPELKIKLMSNPVFQRQNGRGGVFTALWNFKAHDTTQLNDVVGYVRGLPTTVKFEPVQKGMTSITALMGIKTDGLAMSRLLENKCHIAKPLVVHEGLEHWDVITEEGPGTKKLLDELAEVGEIKVKSLGKHEVENNEFELTEKQREALSLAVKRGYYSWPKKVTLEELAELAGVSRVTFENHLRKAEARAVGPLLSQSVFEEEDDDDLLGVVRRRATKPAGPKQPRPGDFIQMSAYIDLEQYQVFELKHPFYVEMMDKMVEAAEKERNGEVRLLEIGAGTGIFTSKLRKVKDASMTCVEPDANCFKTLVKALDGGNPKLRLVKEDGVVYKGTAPFDYCFSSFAHHHIPYGKRKEYAENIKANLKKGGAYIVGDEFIPDFGNEEERKESLKRYHNYIIDLAEKQGNHETAELERIFLEKNLQGEEYKISCGMFEEEMRKGGLRVEQKIKMGPMEREDVGGIYVYVVRKA